MQTLQAGSFLNLENDSTVEALKFTAHRLAEHSGSVVAENLNGASLENLANNLWEKAEYVARENERRRLKQIFVENFTERFSELKPEVSAPENSSLEAESNTSGIEATNSVNQSSATEVVESGRSENSIGENVLSSDDSKETTTVVQRNSDEFLGFVENEESTAQASIAESEAKITTAPQETAQTAHETISETIKPEKPTTIDEAPSAENQIAAQIVTSAEKPTDAKPQTAAKKETAATTSVSKNSHPAANGKEPFEFEKCTINLNLTLLPAVAGSRRRSAIISAASHNLPPEIDFLEIAEGEDITSIADLVQKKLERFKQTLPVKYIEQLRTSKTKSAKKSNAANTNTEQTQKESGEQKAQEAKSVETEKMSSTEKVEENKTTVSPAFTPTANQIPSANEIQQSLF